MSSYYGGISASYFGGGVQGPSYGYASSSVQASASTQYYSQLMSAQQSLYSGWGQFGGSPNLGSLYGGFENNTSYQPNLNLYGVNQFGGQPGFNSMYGGYGNDANFGYQAPASYNFGSAFAAYQASELGGSYGNPFGANPLNGMNLSDQSLASTFPSYGSGTYPSGSAFNLGGLSSGLNVTSLLSTAF